VGKSKANHGRTASKGLKRFSLIAAASTLALLAQASTVFALEEPEFIKPVLEEPAPGTPADFVAAKVTYDPATKLAVATGRVVITYGAYTLNASRVTYNQDTGVFTANGSVTLREPNGNVTLADSLELTNKFKQGFARHLKALLTNNVTLSARYAVRKEGKITVFEDSHYTACKDCNTRSGEPLWELVAEETTHDQNEKTLYHVNPRLKIAGQTIFGLPYLEHADPTVKRRTGWLIPTVDISDNIGVGIVTPYFWAIAPDKDITFRPKWTTRQGPIADIEYRQRTENGQFNLRGFGLYELSPRETVEDDRLRGAVASKGDFKLSANWKWGWNGAIASDEAFLEDYDFLDAGIPLTENRHAIAQNEFYVRGLWDRNYVSAQALNFASHDTGTNGGSLPTALPYAQGEHYLNEDILEGQLRFAWRTYSISREDAGTPYTDVNHGTSQSRASADLSWKSEFIGGMGQVFTPFANMRGDLYLNNNLPGTTDDELTTRLLPSAGFDLRMPFIGDHENGQGIFSPVFQFVAATNETDEDAIGNEDAITLNFDHTSLFLADRFTGYDRYEGGVRANLGLTYSFLGTNGGLFKASLGESFHLAGDNSFADGSGLEGSSSDLVGALMFNPWESLSLSYEIRAEEDLSEINRQAAMLSLTFDRFALNAGYLNINAEPAYGRPLDEQWAEFDARVGLSDGWYLFGGARYDIENSELTYRTAGVEFDCDCMNFKVAYTGSDDEDTGDTDHRLMFSIDFATLGGTKVSTGF
jgi:LPS-assembly protein